MIENIVKEFVKKKGYMLGGMPLSKAKSIYVKGKIEKLSANENQYGVSPMAIQAGKDISETANLYPDMADYKLESKLAAQLGVEENNILLTHGGTAALSMIGDTFLCDKDEVLLPSPTYQAYANMINKNNAVKREVRVKEDYSFDFEALWKAITPKTKMIILCNPNNPTGVYADKQQVVEFMKKMPPDIILLVDEAYIQFVEKENASMVDYVSQTTNLAIVQTFSKIYGMAGYRLGYVIANREIINALRCVWDPAAPGTIALAAGCAALQDKDFVQKTRNGIKAGRTYIKQELEKMGVRVYDSRTNFIFFDCGIQADILAEKILEESGVLIRGTFEKPRVTIGTGEQNRKFIDAMKNILRERKEKQWKSM